MTEKQIVKYSVTEAAIAKLSDLYMNLTVDGVDDKEGFAQVELGRKTMKRKRNEVENERKVLKSDALAWGKKVDTKANDIKALIEPIETHLTKEGDKIRDEEKRIKEEAEIAEKRKIQDRIDSLLKVGVAMDYFDVASLDDDQFNALYIDSRTVYDAEQKRIGDEERAKEEAEEAAKIAAEKEAERLAEVAKAQQVESDRLKKIAAEQEAKEKELKEAQDKKDREAFEIKVAAEAKAQAEQDAKDEADRVIEVEKQAKLEAERQESLKPDKEKLEDWADDILNITMPDVKDSKAWNLANNTLEAIYEIAKELRSETRGL